MKTIIYLIPGYRESSSRERYKSLGLALKSKDRSIRFVDPDWSKPLSQQVFTLEKNAVVLGFSLGAVLAYLVVEKQPCKKAVFASMTPVHKYPLKLWLKEVYEKDLSKEQALLCARDIKNIKIDLKGLKTPHVILAGESESQKSVIEPDLLVPRTGHRMTSAYVNAIRGII